MCFEIEPDSTHIGLSERRADQEEQQVSTPDRVDAAERDRLIEYLTTLSDVAYAENYADILMDDEDTERDTYLAAYRSPELVGRSEAAARYLLAHVETQFKHRDEHQSSKGWEKAAANFRNRVGFEHRIVKQVLDGLRASRGILPNEPNPRGRAEKRLWNLVMAGEPVDKDTPRRLLEEEREKDRERKAERRRQAKAARKAAPRS